VRGSTNLVDGCEPLKPETRHRFQERGLAIRVESEVTLVGGAFSPWVEMGNAVGIESWMAAAPYGHSSPSSSSIDIAVRSACPAEDATRS